MEVTALYEWNDVSSVVLSETMGWQLQVSFQCNRKGALYMRSMIQNGTVGGGTANKQNLAACLPSVSSMLEFDAPS